jgi:hypothetical protein
MKLRKYKKRKIQFYKNLKIDQWQVKVYLISITESFQSYDMIDLVSAKINFWLTEAVDHHKIAFIIIHEATDGIWILVNWWTCGEMLITKTYFVSFKEKTKILQLPRNASMACVWEMIIIQHERNAWVKHILENAEKPNFIDYNHDIIEGYK